MSYRLQVTGYRQHALMNHVEKLVNAKANRHLQICFRLTCYSCVGKEGELLPRSMGMGWGDMRRLGPSGVRQPYTVFLSDRMIKEEKVPFARMFARM